MKDKKKERWKQERKSALRGNRVVYIRDGDCDLGPYTAATLNAPGSSKIS